MAGKLKVSQPRFQEGADMPGVQIFPFAGGNQAGANLLPVVRVRQTDHFTLLYAGITRQDRFYLRGDDFFTAPVDDLLDTSHIVQVSAGVEKS